MKNIVCTTGSFDGELHKGHINLLKYASDFGELFVAIVTDNYIRNVKKREPIFSQSMRAFNLFNTGLVRGVMILSNDQMHNMSLILDLSPTIYIFGGDQGTTDRIEWNKMLESKLVSHGVEIKRATRLPGLSTSSLLKGIN